ncbi:phosphocholine-specific phospholipase C [Dyadobacter frigoris]|uniref:phospholipase C n=1 Tax=Dyadobacter frigoris TaxID=2576211 RepID=A0A4U6CWU4_9BACT|nr:phospholipase C, phosphocholine-specific [Dyadobacter frigoris]TKT88127.1 phospholipase C, phosphocholine-specific [Dyadobacter frigoris]GLU53741.1 phospholipase C precursor [Dyadobacter frigoris]
MDSRREFIKKAAMLSGGAGLLSVLPLSIQKALAIDPQPGSTYLDAEHVVILMQENRSFDHCYGSLRGVRGFNDPRAISLPNKNLVWLQTNAAGETYTPFRLNMKDSKATWMGSLPHSWPNQVDARNEGKYDKWLIAKQAGHKDYTKMPLTQGFYNREDIPFYYALADAFTVCDQNFCSSLTGTTPNRLFLWTGTVREKQNTEAYANVRNENVEYEKQANWTTFPERLEDHGVSWRIYQNEISLPMGFEGEEESWLANFTDNPIEWFTQYHVRYSTGFQKHLKNQAAQLPKEITDLENKIKTLAPGKDADLAQNALKEKLGLQEIVKKELSEWSTENFAKLSQREKNLHQKAFTTNIKDPDYHEVTSFKYEEGETSREVKLPKGDVLHQFRDDVKTGKLPTVSWLVAPENFSDHPTSPWYGAWYVSEVMDILTKNPEVWKKTIFILCYDENDGYFDHVPPYVVPNPYKEDTGKTSEGIDTKVEFVTLEQDMKKKAKKESRESPIGLGFRVPLLVASPWNRGGNVCSEVFDHTSVIQFLEKFTSHKSGKKIEETNISAWRRTICGDLTSTFTPYDGQKIPLPAFVKHDEFIEGIHKAKFKGLPNGYKSLSATEISQINQDPSASQYMPQQEKGTRPARALPYQLYADGHLSADKKSFEIKLKSGNTIFGKDSAGSPFMVYAPGKYKDENVKVWNYAVKPGDVLNDSYKIGNFENQNYQLRAYGPNGFFREYTGNVNDPLVDVQCEYQLDKNKKPTGNIELIIKNTDPKNKITVEIADNAYKSAGQKKTLEAAGSKSSTTVIVLNLEKSHSWYDFSLNFEGHKETQKRFAGHVETGKESISDPLMGRIS